jgi:hypothetical protein
MDVREKAQRREPAPRLKNNAPIGALKKKKKEKEKEKGRVKKTAICRTVVKLRKIEKYTINN